LLKAQVNERSRPDAFNNKFKELISIQYCTFIILSVVVVGGGGYYFLELV
jgi:nitrate reductase NapE component